MVALLSIHFPVDKYRVLRPSVSEVICMVTHTSPLFLPAFKNGDQYFGVGPLCPTTGNQFNKRNGSSAIYRVNCVKKASY